MWLAHTFWGLQELWYGHCSLSSTCQNHHRQVNIEYTEHVQQIKINTSIYVPGISILGFQSVRDFWKNNQSILSGRLRNQNVECYYENHRQVWQVSHNWNTPECSKEQPVKSHCRQCLWWNWEQFKIRNSLLQFGSESLYFPHVLDKNLKIKIHNIVDLPVNSKWFW